MMSVNRFLLFILFFSGVILLPGCSWDSVQRTTYETMESVRQQECKKQPDSDCPEERTRYDDYQAERERLQE